MKSPASSNSLALTLSNQAVKERPTRFELDFADDDIPKLAGPASADVLELPGSNSDCNGDCNGDCDV